MMRFLKSTLFPRTISLKKKKDSRDVEIKNLKERVILLEEENKKSYQAIQDISSFLSQMSIIVSSLASDVATVSDEILSGPREDELDKVLKTYFDADDDGYIH